MAFFPRDYHLNGANCRGCVDEERGNFWKVLRGFPVVEEVVFLEEASMRGWKFVPEYVGCGTYLVSEHDFLERFSDPLADESQESFECIVTELAYAFNLHYLSTRGYSFLRHNFLFANYADHLTTIHEGGWLHLDVKPNNLLFSPWKGESFLTDFGNCRMVPAVVDERWGTPHYMSPEQVEGGRVDERADVYCLGGTIYDMLTGVIPFFEAETVDELLVMQVNGVPKEPRERNIEVSQGMNDLVMRCLEKDPADRPSMRELAYGLRRIV